MSVRLPSTIRGQFVLVASYFHNADDQGMLHVVVRTGDENSQNEHSLVQVNFTLLIILTIVSPSQFF